MRIVPLSRMSWGLVALAVCASLLLLPPTDASLHSGAILPHASPAPRWTAPYPLPVQFARYAIVTTDFSSGDISLLGACTVLTVGGHTALSFPLGARSSSQAQAL
jgi:hypothetical protein